MQRSSLPPRALVVPLAVLAAAACGATDERVAPAGALPDVERNATGDELHLDVETYTLPNGLTIVLYEDHSLPKAVINTWFAVGSKDEAPGRTGFAHLFEHLMFMGTERVPDNQFDILMESGGGSNNASTSTDRTNYYSQGPSALLPTLLWLDADRLEALADNMTQEKLDRQRAVVRNERRQTSENVPYGKARLMIPAAMFPEGHPYHHPVIGSHEDLEAATLEDVIEFFRTYYVPGNASLVVAGDFDAAEVKRILEQTFGAIPAKPMPAHRTASPMVMHGETRLVDVDKVEFPKLYLAWHSPGFYRPGDAEMDILGGVLSGGPSSRLERRLVIDTGLAQSVAAYQASRELGSTFQIEAVAAPGADLEAIKREILAVLDELERTGPTQDEMQRVQARLEADFLHGMESLLARADAINRYRHYFGMADGFQRDLERWTSATKETVRDQARVVFSGGRLDLRILPEGATLELASLDDRPTDFATRTFTPPAPQSFRLSNGIEVHAIERPGTRLFSGSLVVAGGEALLPAEQSGLAALTARMLESGAAGLDASSFADAVESLGAQVSASADRREMILRVDGLTSRMGDTLDRFADMVLRANMDPADFDREQGLTLAGIRSRKDNPNAVGRNVARMLLFGEDDVRGRPVAGVLETVEALELQDLQDSQAMLLDPENATFVFVGDFELARLERELEERFSSWRSSSDASPPELPPLVDPAPGRVVLVDRPDAPQTLIYAIRPVARREGAERAASYCANVVFGGTFTSRLNANLREDKGYTYGARSSIVEGRDQVLLVAASAVRTDVTGAALTEFKREFEALATDGVTPDELAKAVETSRRQIVETAETTNAQAQALVGLVTEGRPLDSIAADLAALGTVDLAAANSEARGGDYGWDDLLIVLVGDRAAILTQLAEAGFPAPTEADEEGRLKP